MSAPTYYDTHRPCRCGAQPGELHAEDCSVARCLWTGGQRFSCSAGLGAEVVRALVRHREIDLADRLREYLDVDDDEHDCGADVWTGDWPGVAECRAFGWWSWFGPDLGLVGWQRIEPEDIEAFRQEHPSVTVSEDLNRLVVEASWDRGAGRWVQR